MKLDNENKVFILEGEEEIQFFRARILNYFINERLPSYITRDHINNIQDLKNDLKNMLIGSIDVKTMEYPIRILKVFGYTPTKILKIGSTFLKKFFDKDGNKKDGLEFKIVKTDQPREVKE